MEFDRDSDESVPEVHGRDVCCRSGISDQLPHVLMTQEWSWQQLSSIVSSFAVALSSQLIPALQSRTECHSVTNI